MYVFGLHWVFVAACGPSPVAARGVAAHGLLTAVTSLAVEHRLSSCGTRVQFPCGMWNLRGSRIKPVLPALAGRFPTTGPPGKS